jgi:hypothetical protein
MILCLCENVKEGDYDRYHLIGTVCGKCKMNNTINNVSSLIIEDLEKQKEILATRYEYTDDRKEREILKDTVRAANRMIDYYTEINETKD